ncbi:TPA: hypothetical protein HMU57_23160, partial [Escherichia coli]|nr:hypothetical protein [Escherichia coli]
VRPGMGAACSCNCACILVTVPVTRALIGRKKIFRFRCDAALNGAHVQGHDPPLIPINLQGKESGQGY